MTGPIHERVALHDLNDPILIAAFTAPHKVGATASSALSFLMEQWGAQLVAEFESEDCYNFVRIRPQLRRDGDQTFVDWPRCLVYLANPPESDRSFLFLIGIEPSLRWRSFVEAAGDFAKRAGVRTSVVVRAVPAAISHRQPASILATYSEPGLQDQFQLTPPPYMEGPLDIGAVLNLHLRELGCQTVDLYAMEPYYAPAFPNASAGLAILRALGAAFGIEVSAPELSKAAEGQLAAIESAIADSEEMKAAILALEQRNASILESGGSGWSTPKSLAQGDPGTAAEPLNTEDVLREVEELLRAGRDTPKA